MNSDIVKDRWKQLRDEIQERWSKFTDDDLDLIEGRADQLIDLLQEKYGYARERAEQEVDAFVEEMQQKEDTTPMARRK